MTTGHGSDTDRGGEGDRPDQLGSGAESAADLGGEGDRPDPGRVWYAGYGSNLRRDRFMLYLTGGHIEGRDRGHHGARDATPPVGHEVGRIPHRLHFGGESRRWGGGVAFVDPREGSGEAVVRLWNLTHEQFEDVAAQENGLEPGRVTVDLGELEEHRAVDIGGPWYGHGLWLGRRRGMPVVTFTQRVLFEPNPPTPAYLEMVAAGLLEVGLGVAEAVDYLLGASGVAPHWTPQRLRSLVAGVGDPEPHP